MTDPDLIASFVRDESHFTPAGAPALVLIPRTTEEVATALAVAHELGVAVVTRGAGSGLSGGANATEGCIVLSTRRLSRIVEVDTTERLLVAQPGVVTADVRAEAERHGLFYPPDPGSVATCTIGGNVATNAGGMCCVKYGVTGDYVLGLEVVLADGRTMRTGRRTVKGVAGYDLTRLFVGSEGTLGVITEVTLRLLPTPSEAHSVLATFGDVAGAGRAVQAITQTRVTPSVFEILDRTTLRAIESMTPLGFDGSVGAVLLLQSDSSTAKEDAEALADACESADALDVVQSDNPDEARTLLEARRLALPSLERLGDWLLDDVCVPRSQVVALIEHVETIASDEGLTIGLFGHAGDGNMHPTVIYDGSTPEGRDTALRAFDRITASALELGGTVTGEHGVGRLKTQWLRRELDAVATEVHGAIKRALDPTSTLNPGVALPAE
ncbi:FAD-binding oxidoreductase [Nocardioides islandensis]|uniref:FAD-binding oxidoreductase n=1 Tax=Nocardioides islandensis TaxID=433663 RepID=UPI002B27629C|nr:FAD-linked oxidase C-terminal domain-containing protein [Nocardioides islandensis]